ncbi:protein ZGRF1 [Phyllostomus hastatus]|uniref:protein ZGRF1 n=1 Tax=Phyllostomus hastatus TaxID=9423 RepID=UPI001E682C5C|nr:protein ZGRF1 [Phyllostomus hastatus]XP_045687224.1 protein ZGRF1 [Phyllostomus hastatus]XP_045687225.1 protein ZGRF1 [Phyllostomus hastatus]
MENQEFIVLYTHQKMKKSKVWQDGILKITHLGNKAILYDDKGQCLESLFLKCLEVNPGDDLESDRYLITVEEVRAAGSRAVHQKVDQEASALRPRQLMSSGRSLGCQPAGLKRKFTGFQGPRQMPKKMVIMENGEPTVSPEAANPGPIFLSPFLRVPPLFSVAGKKDVNSVAADPEDRGQFLSKDRGRNGPPLSSVGSAQSSRGDLEVLWGGEQSVSLLASEPMERGSLASHCLGAAQNVRSKAQILALLRSRSTSTCKETDSAMAGHFPRVQPQGSLNIPANPECLTDQEECAEGSTGSLQYQQPSGSTVRSKSRWAAYLSSQSSPVHSSAVDGNDLEGKPMAPGDNIDLNLRDLLVQKNVQFFEPDAENRKNYDEDKPVVNTDPFWDREIKLKIPSFCESSLPVTCGNVENNGLVSKSDAQENTNIPVTQNDWMCTKGSLVRENVQEINTCGVPEKGCEQTVSSLPESDCLQMESSLSSTCRISDAITDMLSRRSADCESLSIQEPIRNVTQPFLEVNFNLNNFETSDSEEESQENSGMPQDPEGWEKDTLAGDCSSGVQKRGEAVRCEEGGSAPLTLLLPVGGKPTGTFPTKEALLSRLWSKAGPGGDGVQGWGDPAVQWPDEVYVVNEDVETPTQVRSNSHFALLPNKSKGMNSNLHIPHFLSMDTNQTLESNLFSETTQHQPFIMESDLGENDNQVLPLTSGSDNSIQLVSASQSHADGCIALDKSDPQVPNSLFYPLGRKQPISNDTEACVPESEDVGGIPSLAQDHTEGDSAGENRQYWKSPRHSSEPSGLGSSISLLKSLTEHTTALEGLEILKKKNATYTPRGMLQTHGPASSPEARKPLVTVVSPAVPKSPHLTQDSQQCSPGTREENEVEAGEPLQSLQFFSLGSEEEPAFPPVTPKQIARETWDPQPVEFQGHRVQGSATSAVTVRGYSSQPAYGQAPGCLEPRGCMAGTRFPVAGPPGARLQAALLQFPDEENFPKGGDIFNIEDNFQVVAESNEDSTANDYFLPKDSELSCHYLDYNFKSAERTSWEANKVTSPEQKVSTLSPVSTFSLDLQDEDFELEFPEESLKARTSPVTKKFSSPESHDLPRHPALSRTRFPLVTVPAAPGPLPGGCAEPVVGPVHSRPEDPSEASLCQAPREVSPGAASRLHGTPVRSKWLKYQNTAQGGPSTPSGAQPSASASCAGAVCGMRCGAAGGSPCTVEDSLLGGESTRLWVLSCALRGQQPGAGPQDYVCRNKALFLSSKLASDTEEVQSMSGGSACCGRDVTHSQEVDVSELCFPSQQKTKCVALPRRQTHIPAVFQSPSQYKQVFTSCLTEHLNILLFGLAQRLHQALSAVDMSFYTSNGEKLKTVENKAPSCHHHQPAKLVTVQKEGPNKGRLFYTCDAPKADRCKFFKWFEEVSSGHLTQEEPPPATVLSDVKSVGLYLRSRKVPLYEECQLLVRKGFDFQRKQHGKLKKFTTMNPDFYNEPKSKLYLKLSRKESSSTYSKDDLWVVSKTLDFELDTFIACSAFFGPSSANEVELLPLKGYFPSRWLTDTVVHALLVCNASTELTTLKNIQDYFNPATLPLTQHLLAMSSSIAVSNKRVDRRKFIPPAFSNTNTKRDLPSLEAALQLANELIETHKLNEDQATALTQIARMVASHGRAEEGKGPHTCTLPITIVHGVFGAGKSYLLAVVILFFVQLFEKSEAPTVGNARPWKLLVSSSTNVAVDRVLLGLLSLGFEKFVRVGSIRKIAKPVLPYSLHAGSENANEQLKELHALMREDLSPVDRVHVRRSIEQHKLGTNRTLLKQVRVVGATCAACPFPCMDGLRFPVVVLDECSQMTEPASLLPVARFECEKLILVGDPKQLPPTVQGSDAAHEHGLEQTLFDRLCLMGHKPVVLRTQYRCHPAITAVANDLFYGGTLRNGVSETERSPLLGWLPTLCFYNVQGQEQIEGGNSFHNVAEAAFTLTLIQSLVAGGVAGSEIGVITLYRAQVCKLCHSLRAVASDQPGLRAVQVSTVDAFQGAEREVIILSCVRTRQVGFIDSERRVNVALTRGRRHLLIVGNLACLRRNRLWGRVIQHCEGREGGLQHASQCEPQLRQLLQDRSGHHAAEKQKKKRGHDKPEDTSHSQKGVEPSCL